MKNRCGRVGVGAGFGVGLAALSCGVMAGSASAGAAMDVRFYTGQAFTIPGRPDLPGFEVQRVLPPSPLSFLGGPSINAAGDVAMTLSLKRTDTNVTFGDAVFWFDGDAGSAATPQLVALANDPVPGQSVGVTYDQFLGRRLILDSAGRLAFGSQWERPGTFAVDTAIQVYTPDGVGSPGSAGVRTVVRDSDTDPQVVPDVDPLNPAFGRVITSLNGTVVNAFGSPYVFNANRVAFGSGISPPPGETGSPWTALYREDQAGGSGPNQNSALKLLARNGTGSSFAPSLGVNAVNANGLNSFRTTIFPGSPDPAFSAWVTFFNDVSIEVQSGSGAGGDISFGSFSSAAGFNNAGQTAFRARFSDLAASDSGIFVTLNPNGIIATEGIVAAGTPDLGSPQGIGIPDGVPDFVFNDFILGQAPLLNANGKVVFQHFARTNDGSQSIRGLWSSRTGVLTGLDPVALVGDQAPGLPDGYTIHNFGLNGSTDVYIAMNANDDVAFQGQYRSPEGFIGNGVWAEKDGELQLVAAQHFTQITNPDGSQFIVRGVGFTGGSGNQDGRPSGFSDDGRVAFRADGQGTLQGAMVVATLGVDAFLPGDFSGNGSVEQADLDLVLTNWGVNTIVNGRAVIPNGWRNYAEDTGVVNQNELDAVLTNWGGSAAPSFALNPGLTAVPEPGALAGLALLAGAGWRCRG